MPEYSSAVIRNIWDKVGEQPSLLDFDSALGRSKTRKITDAQMTNGQPVVTSVSGPFSAQDVGKRFVVSGAAGAADPLIGTCTAYTDSQHVTLNVNASATVSSATCVFGHNSRDAIVAGLSSTAVRDCGSLLIPAGLWMVWGGTMDIPSGVTVYGFGRSSILYAADFTDSALYATGKERIGIRSLSFLSHAYTRGERSETGAAWLLNCNDVSLGDIYIRGGKSAGLYIDGCVGGELENIDIQQTKADGIHVVGSAARGSSRIRLRGIHGYQTGDDTVGIVSYLANGQCDDIRCENVTAIDTVGGRGIACIGSTNVVFDGYRVKNAGSHGAICAYESEIPSVRVETHIPAAVRFLNGVIESIDSAPGFNAIIVTGEDAGHIVDDVTIENLTIKASNQSLIEYASDVRVSRWKIRSGNYNGLLVKNSSDVSVEGSTLKTVAEAGILFDNVDRGRIDNNDLIECQASTGNASVGRIHVVNSNDVIGSGNRDFRSASVDSFGPFLSSSNTACHVEVTEIDTDGATSYKMKGHQYDSGTRQLLLETDRYVNEGEYGVVSQKGAYIHNGPVQLEGNKSFMGSGGAAELKLYSGQASLSAEAGIDANFNRSGASGSSTFDLNRNSILQLRVDASGHVLCRGGVKPGLTASGHGLYAVTGGSPEGVVAAPVGSMCISDSGNVNLTLYLKVSGTSTANGWAVVIADAGIPSPTGNSKKILQVNEAATAYILGKVALADGTKQMDYAGISDPGFLQRSGNTIIGVTSIAISYIQGLQDILDDLQSQIDDKSDIGHSHSVSGSTSTDGEPAHSHSVSGSTN